MRHYELTTIGPVPDCWPGIFVRRQLELRGKIRMVLRDAKVSLSRECFALACSHYEAEEVDCALEALVHDRVLSVDDSRYSITTEIPCGAAPPQTN